MLCDLSVPSLPPQTHIVRCRRIEVAKYLIEVHGCSAGCTDNSGQTPLHLACLWVHRNPSAVRIMWVVHVAYAAYYRPISIIDLARIDYRPPQNPKCACPVRLTEAYVGLRGCDPDLTSCLRSVALCNTDPHLPNECVFCTNGRQRSRHKNLESLVQGLFFPVFYSLMQHGKCTDIKHFSQEHSSSNGRT